MAEVALETCHPGPGRAEQDPASWWSAVLEGCDELRGRIAGGFGSVEVVGLTGARETFGLFGTRRALLPAILWSDRRAGAAAGRLARGEGSTRRTRAAPADRSNAASVGRRSSPGWRSTTRRSSQRPRMDPHPP